jgi:hypothetical protein
MVSFQHDASRCGRRTCSAWEWLQARCVVSGRERKAADDAPATDDDDDALLAAACLLVAGLAMVMERLDGVWLRDD